MKALSIKQPWAWMIAAGHKTIETRTWPTKYRGDLLIVSSKGKMTREVQESFEQLYPDKLSEVLYGKALATCHLVDCRLMTSDDVNAARCSTYDKAVSWVLENVKKIQPFDVLGQLSLYNVEMPYERFPVDGDYEFKERMAILAVDNDVDLHPAHLRNRALKQLREDAGW